MLPMRYSIDLLKEAQKGDIVSLNRLLQECRVDLPRYARKYCAAGNVEDAVQESLIHVARTLPALRSLDAFASYLFTIVRRECLRLGRVFTRRETTAAEVHRYTSCSAQELRLEITMAIQSLPEIYREVILLRDFEELSVREIAEHLQMKPATVKTRLHRGREQMREYLSG